MKAYIFLFGIIIWGVIVYSVVDLLHYSDGVKAIITLFLSILIILVLKIIDEALDNNE